MSNKNFKAVAIFVAFALAFALLMGTARGLAEPFAQVVLVSAGSAIFGSGLTFFLIQLFQSSE